MRRLMDARSQDGFKPFGFEGMYNEDDKRFKDGPIKVLPHDYESEKRIWWDGEFYEEMTEFYRAPDKSLAPTIRMVDVKNSAHDYRLMRSMTG